MLVQAQVHVEAARGEEVSREVPPQPRIEGQQNLHDITHPRAGGHAQADFLPTLEKRAKGRWNHDGDIERPGQDGG